MVKGNRLIRTSLAAGICCAACLTAGPALAQDMAAAEALFREGRELFKAGKITEACQKFQESQRLDSSSGTLLNLANCHERDGRTASAWAEFLEASRLARRENEEGRSAEGKRRAQLLEGKLSYLSLTITETVPGMVIFRDKVELSQAALRSRIPIDPGEHDIRASAPGYQEWSTKVVIGRESDSQTVTVPKLEPAVEEQPPEDAPAEPVTKPDDQPATAEADLADVSDNTLAYVIGGAGIVLTGVGTVFGFMAMSSYDEADTACPSHTGCSQDAMDSRDSADLSANIANIGVGLGIVGIGVGAVLLLTSGGSDEAAPQDQAGVTFTPQVGPGAAGAVLQGRF